MSKSFAEKRDLKALTVLGMMSAVEVSNENITDKNKDNKLIILTSFGYVIPEKIIPKHELPEELNEENYPTFITSSATEGVKNMLKENNNEDVLDTQTSFVLERVQIKPFNSNVTHNLQSMILFSDQIVGLSFGNFSEY